MRAGDAGAVADLVEQLGYPTSEEAIAPRLEALTASDVDRVVVAELDGTVVGLAALHTSLTLEYDQPAAKLSAIVVDEAARGLGVGRALVEALVLEARERGCRLIFLTTAERRSDAHSFYGRLGFQYTGRRYAKTLR